MALPIEKKVLLPRAWELWEWRAYSEAYSQAVRSSLQGCQAFRETELELKSCPPLETGYWALPCFGGNWLCYSRNEFTWCLANPPWEAPRWEGSPGQVNC